MFRLRPLFLFAVAGVGTAAIPSADAQTYCFPEALSVPFQKCAPTVFTDVRWNGAFEVLNDEMMDPEFRGLNYSEGGQKFLLLAWNVTTNVGDNEPTQPDWEAKWDKDNIRVFFANSSTTPSSGYIIEIKRNAFRNLTSCSVGCGSLGAVLWKKAAGGDWWEEVARRELGGTGTSTAPEWFLNDIQGSLVCDPAGCLDGTPCTACTTWTVTMKIPLSSPPGDISKGLDLPSPFYFGYQTFRSQSISGVSGVTVVPNHWPKKPAGSPPPASTLDVPTFDDPVATPSAVAPDLAAIQLPGGSALCSKGIWIDSSRITLSPGGTDGTSIEFKKQLGPAGLPGIQNTFTARAKNEMGYPVPETAISARFRIADWGAVLGDSPSWTDVPGTTDHPAPSTPGGSCAAVVHSGTGLASIASGGDFTMECKWTLTDEQKCKYGRAQMEAANPGSCGGTTPQPGDHYPHQCVLVELSRTPGTAIPALPAGAQPPFFSSRSAYKNMHFVAASEVLRSAKLEVLAQPRGAAEAHVALQKRDVYVYVETNNMPATVPAARPGILSRPEVLKKISDPNLATKLDKLGVREGKIGSAVSLAIQERARQGKITHREIAAILPTYVAHVWQDTGRRARVKGRNVTVLAAAPSFGYYVSHDGPLVGWRFGIAGKGVTKIGPNFYKISVPTKGGLAVKPWLRACEDARCLTAKAPPP
jgi:hypothetical protein